MQKAVENENKRAFRYFRKQRSSSRLFVVEKETLKQTGFSKGTLLIRGVLYIFG